MKTEAYHIIGKMNGAAMLVVADHASNHVPYDIDLGIHRDLLDDHIAIDIGVAEVAELLTRQLDCAAILGGASRLVIDLNREEDAHGLLPRSSDGHAIPGNHDADIEARLDRFWRPYHEMLAAMIAEHQPQILLSLHSFTPSLKSRSEARPWDIGVLYNKDDRAARIAIPMLAAAGLHVGDQLPYSGKVLNATMNRHGEGNDIPYLGVEMRQDLVSDPAGQRKFSDILAPILIECRNSLA
ncbi:MAG: N-formylglutamate amidohydrolase [Alphaproteobacteria bacterium]|nr:N-formylglutamate amidohydrolase [Alphaproteobacteria bacterium]